MSKVEQFAIPTLRPMIAGNHPRRLSRHDQYVLALWFSLRAMIFDSYSSNGSTDREYFSAQERAEFARAQVPLKGIRVWLAAMDTDWGGAYFSCQSSILADKKAGIEIITGVAGHTAFQMFVSKGDNPLRILGHLNSVDIEKLSTPAWSDTVAQIWPRRPVTRWPLERLTEQGFYSFIDRFGFTFPP
ncbi:MAG: hypothetical protein HY646_09910 [Acidobacteria bacterium]|nr:hypothetical protein [Acidobacteriota bacterium]